MNWHQLSARVVRGDPTAPLLVAFHGFGQQVARSAWWRWLYLDFAKMSNLAEECERREWSLWMPQARWRNWSASDAVCVGSLIYAAQDATGSTSKPHMLGFSDGATLVNRFLFAGTELPGFVSYEGLTPRLECKPAVTRALVVRGMANKDSSRIRLSQVAQASETHQKLNRIGSVDSRLMVAATHRHEWLASMTPQILDWIGS